MHITLSPVRMDTPLSLEIKGDAVILNGDTFDFGPLPEGAVLPADAIQSDVFNAPVTRINGVLHMQITLPHGRNAPRETLFPEPILNPPDGPVTLPAYTIEEPSDED